MCFCKMTKKKKKKKKKKNWSKKNHQSQKRLRLQKLHQLCQLEKRRLFQTSLAPASAASCFAKEVRSYTLLVLNCFAKSNRCCWIKVYQSFLKRHLLCCCADQNQIDFISPKFRYYSRPVQQRGPLWHLQAPSKQKWWH